MAMKPDPTSLLARRRYQTSIRDLDFAEGWTSIPSLGLDVSAPLGDVAAPDPAIRYARATYRDALRYCAQEDVALLTADALEALRGVLPTIRPVTLPALPPMSSVEWSRVHDLLVAERLAAIGAPVAVNIGKHWVRGAPGGRSWLMGWHVDELGAYGARKGPGWVQPRPAKGSHGAHDDRHVDYSSTVLVMRPSVAVDVDALSSAIVGPVRVALEAARSLFLTAEPVESTGAAIVRVASSQVGVREATGRNDGPQIKRYFEGCTRRVKGVERPTGWVSGWDWCAAFASWVLHVALGLPVGAVVPVGRRIAVRELVEDARAAGRLETSSAYRPKPGDLYIGARGGGDPLLGGTGHVRIAVEAHATTYTAIGGNESNAVHRATHRYDDATWRAWIRVT